MATSGGGESESSSTRSPSRGGGSYHTPPDIPGILRASHADQVNKWNRAADIPHELPHERVFPIQIGSELFRLSGASISSDGMSPSPPPPLPLLYSHHNSRPKSNFNLTIPEHPLTSPNISNASSAPRLRAGMNRATCERCI